MNVVKELEVPNMETIEILKGKIDYYQDQITQNRSQIAVAQEHIKTAKQEIRKIQNGEEAQRTKKFWNDLGTEFGVLNHPKFDLLCSKAWEQGHAHGYSEVRICFENLLDFLQ